MFENIFNRTSQNIGNSLNQGLEYLNYNKLDVENLRKDLDKLQLTTMNGVGSIVENMENKNDSVPSTNNKIEKLEDTFNKVLTEYNITYKLFSDELMNNINTDKDIQQYFGQVITSGDGNYIYVNDYGYTHKYSNDAWSKNSNNCPNNPIELNKADLNKFLKNGPDMGVGQPCKIAGKNIRNIDTNERAWVDIQGNKHVYSCDVWNNKSKSCNIPVVELTNTEYESIPTGGNMISTNKCNRLDIDPNVLLSLNKLNDVLLYLAMQLNNELPSIATEDKNLQENIQKQHDELKSYVEKLRKDKLLINKFKEKKNSMEGEYENSLLRISSTKTRYMVWLLTTLLLFSLIIYVIFNNNTMSNMVVGVLSVALLVYILGNYLYKKNIII